jgi:hypothetical protein
MFLSVTSTLIFISPPFSVLDSLFCRELVFGQLNYTSPERPNQAVFIERHVPFLVVASVAGGNFLGPALALRDYMVPSMGIGRFLCMNLILPNPNRSPAIEAERIRMPE